MIKKFTRSRDELSRQRRDLRWEAVYYCRNCYRTP
jgi:hypothetical protein